MHAGAHHHSHHLREEDTMTTVYNLCKLLIDRGRTDGLQDKMDVYLAADRLTPEEYQELAGLLAPEKT